VVNRVLVPVDVYVVEVPAGAAPPSTGAHSSIPGGAPSSFSAYPGARTFYFLQSPIFRQRKRGTIYGFENENEMLTWLSVFSQAVSVVTASYGAKRLMFHDVGCDAQTNSVPALDRCWQALHGLVLQWCTARHC
jgi:hypothetical protein